jgi:predicted negative regulator of RcsB-dependent stress response
MRDLDSNVLLAVIAFVLFFAMMFGFAAYSDTQNMECKRAAIEKTMTAIEIQAICK